MTHRERFVAVARGEESDYIPIFGFPGAPGMAGGCMQKTYEQLVATGMPDVGGSMKLGSPRSDVEGWWRYWGTTGPISPGFSPAEPPRGVKSEKRIEGDWEIIEWETGAVTRQVIDNDVTYSMPEFRTYHVRDRASWKFYRDRMTPGSLWSTERIDEAARRLDAREHPLSIGAGSTWGALRGLMGPETAATVLYDDPALAHEIIEWGSWIRRTYTFPLVERLRPEILQAGEDNCYKGGMLISPTHFREFCSPAYREIGTVARDCGVTMVAIDTDGNAMELVPIVEECGVNAIFPFEVKAGNDLFRLRRQHPNFILMGWLEKEVVNAGNEGLIREEILSKVPPLLAQKRYFPNGDHGIQPMVTFPNLCRFMTLLHEVTGNPEGDFPRMSA
jgi:uroporphyrinogen-III decarboxylase